MTANKSAPGAHSPEDQQVSDGAGAERPDKP